MALGVDHEACLHGDRFIGSTQISSPTDLPDSANPSSQPRMEQYPLLPLWSFTSPSSLPEGLMLIEWFCSPDFPYLELNWLFLLFCSTWEEKRRKCYPSGGSEFSLGRTQSLKEFGLKRQRIPCSKRTIEKLQQIDHNTLALGELEPVCSVFWRCQVPAVSWQGANTCHGVLRFMGMYN